MGRIVRELRRVASMKLAGLAVELWPAHSVKDAVVLARWVHVFKAMGEASDD